MLEKLDGHMAFPLFIASRLNGLTLLKSISQILEGQFVLGLFIILHEAQNSLLAQLLAQTPFLAFFLKYQLVILA